MDDKKINILKGIAESILKKCNSHNLESEITLIYKKDATSRFANSQINQNIEENSISIDLTVSKGKRFTTEKTTEISEQGIDTLVSNVKRSIESSQDIPFYSGFIESDSSKYPNIKMNSSFWDVEKRANTVADIVNFAEGISKNVKLAGTCASEDSIYYFESSNGRKFSFPFIINHFKVNSIVENGPNRGYGQKEMYWRDKEPNYNYLTEESLNIANSTLNEIAVDPGQYKVVLSPQAVADLMIFIQYTLLAGYYHGGQSFISELGKKTFDEQFDISDLPLDASLSRVALPIDAEGVSRRNKKVIDKGSVVFVPYSSFDASQFLKDKNKATGDSFEQNFALCTSFVQTSGTETPSGLLKEVENGLLINRFWYTRVTNPNTGGLTGVTRYGVYKIENSELGPAVNNLRYTDAFTEFWKPGNILAIGKEQVMNEINTTCGMALRKFNFTSKV